MLGSAEIAVNWFPPQCNSFNVLGSTGSVVNWFSSQYNSFNVIGSTGSVVKNLFDKSRIVTSIL